MRTPKPAPLTVNMPEALAQAVQAGMGLAMLPVPTALQGIREGSLTHVLPGVRAVPHNIYALYASRQYLDAKIKTLVEFLRDTVPQKIAGHEEALEAAQARHVRAMGYLA